MSRTIIRVPHNKTENEIKNLVEPFLMQNSFSRLLYNNIEEVWRKGTGMMTAMQYIKLKYEENTLILSAWIQDGVGNVIGGKERDLSGITGVIPKKSLKKTIEQIRQLL